MRSLRFACLGVFLALAVISVATGAAQSLGRPTTIVATTESLSDLRTWDARVDTMRDEGTLRLRQVREDTLLPGRTHERWDQYYRGVRVFGGDLTRQLNNGQTASLFGRLYIDIDIDPSPKLSSDEAKQIIQTLASVEIGPGRLPALVVLLKDEGGYVLAYTERAFTRSGELIAYFIDANTGAVAFQYSDLKTQSAVGKGVGVLNDQQKVSATLNARRYVAYDLLRPPPAQPGPIGTGLSGLIRTYDMKENVTRTIDVLNGVTGLGVNDLASSADNVWTDGANVDAHVYEGFTYDYYFKRFGRRGLDNANIRIAGLTHPVNRADVLRQPGNIVNAFYLNAFYFTQGIMVYGEGLPNNLQTIINGMRQNWTYMAGALDVVGHELSHGVTEFTSNLIYRNESGALNESFSDMMGTSIEYFFRNPGNGPLQANYLIAEDVVTPGGLRSMANPRAFDDPDHYSRRFTGTSDNGGVHTNAGIPNNVFYLAIEGGTNSTSDLTVQGVGSSNREQIEKVMYRAFAQMMPSNTNFALARTITIEAARDLYGAGSAAERAITQAWTAVGVN